MPCPHEVRFPIQLGGELTGGNWTKCFVEPAPRSLWFMPAATASIDGPWRAADRSTNPTFPVLSWMHAEVKATASTTRHCPVEIPCKAWSARRMVIWRPRIQMMSAIGTKPTCGPSAAMSAIHGKADMMRGYRDYRF